MRLPAHTVMTVINRFRLDRKLAVQMHRDQLCLTTISSLEIIICGMYGVRAAEAANLASY